MNKIFLLKLFGISLLIFVTLLLGALIPIKDKKITETKNELEDTEYKRNVRIFQNHQDYLHYTTKDKIVRLTLILADSGNLTKQEKNALYDEYLEARRLGLVKLYIMHTGSNPPKELDESWKKMSYPEIQNEINNVLKNSNLQKLLDDIKIKKQELDNLERSKTTLIIWITVFQIIGLVLVNIADFLKK